MYHGDTDTLPASYGYGAPVARIWPIHVANKKYLKSCTRYRVLWEKFLGLKARWDALPAVQFTGEAADLEREAKLLIEQMQAEAKLCKIREQSGFVGAGTPALAPGKLYTQGLPTMLGAGAGAGGSGVVIDPATGLPVVADAGAGAGEQPAGMSTTTLLLLGGGALALFLFMRKGGKKSGGSVFAGRS
jgi:hypothetical protein